MGPEVVPEIGAVVPPQPELRLQVSAELLLQGPQHQPEALAVRRMHVLEELIDGNIEAAGIEPKLFFDFSRDGDLVAAGLPLKHMRARAIDGERLDLHEAERAELGTAADAEGELRDGEAEQNEDEHEAGNEARDDDVARELAKHDHRRAEQPHEQ